MLGVDSQFSMVETYLCCIKDEGYLPKNMEGWRVSAIICIFGFLTGIIFSTQGGIHVLNLVDGYAAGLPLFTVVFVESIAISFLLGVDKFQGICEEMIGKQIPKPITFCWRYVCPIFSLGLGISTLVNFFTNDVSELVCRKEIDAKDVAFVPEECKNKTGWAISLAWILGLISLLPIAYSIVKHFREKKAQKNSFSKD